LLPEDGPIRCAEVAALSVDDVAAVQQQVRTRVLRWFVRAGYLDASDAFDMAGWEHGGGFSLVPRYASKPPTAPGWNGYCATARARPSPSIG